MNCFSHLPNICCRYSKEPSLSDGSFEHSQEMILLILMDRKIIKSHINAQKVDYLDLSSSQ